MRAPCELIVTRAVARGELIPDCNPNLIDEIAPAQLFMHSFVGGSLGTALLNTIVTSAVATLIAALLIRARPDQLVKPAPATDPSPAEGFLGGRELLPAETT